MLRSQCHQLLNLHKTANALSSCVSIGIKASKSGTNIAFAKDLVRCQRFVENTGGLRGLRMRSISTTTSVTTSYAKRSLRNQAGRFSTEKEVNRMNSFASSSFLSNCFYRSSRNFSVVMNLEKGHKLGNRFDCIESRSCGPQGLSTIYATTNRIRNNDMSTFLSTKRRFSTLEKSKRARLEGKGGQSSGNLGKVVEISTANANIIRKETDDNSAADHVADQRAGVSEPELKSSAKYDNILKVAIVGRPNTGKSTLFNRLTRGGSNFASTAIVSDVPGTTRDRKDGLGHLCGLPMQIIDTGGFDNRGIVSSGIHQMIEQAMRSADVILLMLDAKDGVNMLDESFAQWIRRKKGFVEGKLRAELAKNVSELDNNALNLKRISKTVIVLANKCEGSFLNDKILNCISDCLKLGLGDPLTISASHGDGLSDLASILIQEARNRGLQDDVSDGSMKLLGGLEPIPLEERKIKMAIMGRPNVGKSSLLNAIVGQERVIAGPTPGLTRDSIGVEWNYNDRHFELVDTAGLTKIHVNPTLAKKSEKEKKLFLEHKQTGRMANVDLPGARLLDPNEDPSQFSYQISELSLTSALNSLKYSQVVIVVVEGEQGRFSKVDLQLAKKVLEEGRAVVIAANKRDLMALIGITGKEYESAVRTHCEAFIKEFGDVPVVSCSATEKEGIDRLLDTAIRTHDAWSKRFSTWVLNKWLADTMVSSPMPRSGNKAIVIKYITQIKARPPTFALFCNAKELPIFFERFLRSKLQQDLNLAGVPVRFLIRRSKGKSATKSLLRHGKKTRRGVGNGADRGVGPRNRGIKHYTSSKETSSLPPSIAELNEVSKGDSSRQLNKGVNAFRSTLQNKQKRVDSRKRRKRLMKKQK